MNILAHRGLWNSREERNKANSLMRAIERGWGIETDIRDYNGALVISHDIATSSSELLEVFLQRYCMGNHDEFLALNIKSDGIQNLLIEQLQKYEIKNYAVFDMSIPEQIIYRELNMHYYTRQSDLEKEPIMYDDSVGVWIDTWYNDWLTPEIICKHLNCNKAVAIISPEIHGRFERDMWSVLKEMHSDNIWLCTDKPEEAEVFFNE